MIHALKDAERMRDDRVRARGAQVVGRQPLENLVREAVRRGQRQIERGRVGHASAVDVGGGHLPLVGERP